jgi:hypothetical protein
LFDFRFFVDHVFAHFGVKHFEMELAGHGAFVLDGSVEVIGSGT